MITAASTTTETRPRTKRSHSFFKEMQDAFVWDSYVVWGKNEIPVLEGERAGSAMTFAT